MTPSPPPAAGTAFSRDTLIEPYEWDVDAKTYHATTSIIGHSQADVFFKKRRKYEGYYVTKKLPLPASTPNQILGTVLHNLVLESDDIRFAVEPRCDKRTKAGKESAARFAEEAAGKMIIPMEQVKHAYGMREALYKNSIARKLLEADGYSEHSIVWRDPETGLQLKSRRDRVHRDGSVIVDVKTAADSDPEPFAYAAQTFGYHRQADWYLAGHHEFTGEVANFVFLVVASSPPYEVSYYELDPEAVALGHRQNRKILSELRSCLERCDFAPAHEKQINLLSLPKRAFFFDEWEVNLDGD